MRFLWLLFIPFLLALTPIYNRHETQDNVDQDFENLFGQAQDRQHTVFLTTPNWQDLQDGEIVIYSSATVNPTVNLQLRLGTTIYSSPFFSIPRGR